MLLRVSKAMFSTVYYFGPYKEYVGVKDGELEFAVKMGAVGPELGSGDKVVLEGGPTELTAVGPNMWKTLAGG